MIKQTRTEKLAVASGLSLVLLAAGACGGGSKPNTAQVNSSNAASPQSNVSGSDAPVDAAKIDAEIVRLESLAERSPGDEDTRDELARAFVRRGDWMRGAGRLREALLDYQRALRLDPDSEAAQKNAAETKEQLGGSEQHGENGEPAPLPITPNVTDDEEKPTPTPKRP